MSLFNSLENKRDKQSKSDVKVRVVKISEVITLEADAVNTAPVTTRCHHKPVTVTLGILLHVSPEITQFLLHRTLNRVDTSKYDLGDTLTTTPTKRVFEEADVDIDAVAVDRNLPILPVQIGLGTHNDGFLDGGSGFDIVTKEVRVRLGLPLSIPTPC